MNLQLFGHPFSSYTWKALIALYANGTPFEFREKDGYYLGRGTNDNKAALTGIVFALIEGVDAGWTTPAVLCAAAAGIAGGVAFFAVELRRAQPLFDVRVLVRPRVAAGALAILASYIATLGMLFLLPQYVQYVQHDSALASGFEVAPFGLGLGALAATSGPLLARYGPRVILLAGLLTASAGFVPLLLLSGDSSPVLVVLGSGIVGCGGGLTYPPATAVIMNDLGTKKAGDGAAVNQLARQVGGALGVAIVGSVFAAIYAALITDEGDVPAAAKESIEAATDVASRLHGAARVDLLDDAVTSFDVAARWGLAVCMAAVLLSAGQRRHRAVRCDAGQAMNHASKAATPSSSVARCIPAVSEKALDQAAPSLAAFPASATSTSPALAVRGSARLAIRSGKGGDVGVMPRGARMRWRTPRGVGGAVTSTQVWAGTR